MGSWEIGIPVYLQKAGTNIGAPSMHDRRVWLVKGNKSDIGEVQSDDRFYSSCKIGI
jgi:hypothetical protein